MVTYAKIYELLDPIIKKNPKITISELRKEHPEIVKKISYWSFRARVNKLTGKKSYGKKKSAKKAAVKKTGMKRKYVRKVVAVDKYSTIVETIQKIVPTTKRMKEYIEIGKILVDNPNAVHSQLKKTGKVKMCDANFYQFRRKFCTMMGLNLTAPSVNSGGNHSQHPVSPVPAPKRKTAIYTVLYERESDGYDAKAKDLVTEIFEALQRERVANLEMVELIHPTKVLEVRSYQK
jgi:hypothetical protein